ncbi:MULTISPECIES: ABC transporter substrate-binding protein [unclassified Idiomarina]|uniref:ABC transporter substrate-binding protein n=1 Tax=unclassified Idiomarina TaxID=2614829 RepID=UPI00257D83B9|nr:MULTISPECIES: ABC transporter substrate-binding protein [unclassified Idiomarina]|tara:strand:+ start:5542 stop:6609 length:1068 start_codon:yes stop_codon:yes gene_type:complete
MRFIAAISLLLVTLFFAVPLKAEVVNFYAWGGSPEVNSYLRWAQKELQEQGIQLRHNKVADASEVVKQIIDGHSNADIIWINGENFHALKEAGALRSIAGEIKAMNNINPELNWQTDFGEPVEELEVPWGVGQFNLISRPGLFAKKTVSAESLLNAARENKGRISYPKPPDFHGTTLLKSLLLSLCPQQRDLFQQPVNSTNANELTEPLWSYLDKLHPLLWQQGENFPSSAGEQISYLANGQLLMAVSFNANDYKTLVNHGRLPAGVERHTLSDKAITNNHYLAVPNSSNNPEAAKTAIEFLLSEKAQQRKADTNRWGDPSVLKSAQGSSLLEPTDDFHASWQEYLEREWSARYQ